MNNGLNAGERIREMRKRYGVTQEFRAEMLGGEHKAIQSWEQGAQQPTIKHMRALAKFFMCRVGDLYPGIRDKEEKT